MAGSYTVLVGRGGSPFNVPEDGGASSFADVSAVGGKAGGAWNGGLGGSGDDSSGNDITTSGGNGGNRFNEFGDGGAGGGAGGSMGDGGVGDMGPDNLTNNIVALGGAGGGPIAGKGGNGGDKDDNPAAQAGTAPGGGGGGKGDNDTGSSRKGGGGRVIVTVESILPITLYSFTARSTERAIDLEWITTNEQDNEKFLIERSTDGRSFSVIGEVPGAGTTEDRQVYTFTDKSPLRGPNYYRLKQIDYDGTFDYSPIETATFAVAGKVTVYPTATRDVLNIISPDDAPATVRVYSLSGALVRRQEFGATAQWELHLGDLPAGTYLVTVETAGQRYQERVVRL